LPIFAEIVGQQQHDAPHATSHHLAHADLLDAALRVERSESEQAEAGNQDCEHRKGAEQLPQARVILVQRLEAVTEETAVDRELRDKSLPGLVDVGERSGNVIAGDTYGSDWGGVQRGMAENKDHRLDVEAQRFEVAVGNHTDDA